MRSTAELPVDEPVLLDRAALGLLAFAGFSVLWTSLAFLLSGSEHGWSYGEIALGGTGTAGRRRPPGSAWPRPDLRAGALHTIRPGPSVVTAGRAGRLAYVAAGYADEFRVGPESDV